MDYYHVQKKKVKRAYTHQMDTANLAFHAVEILFGFTVQPQKFNFIHWIHHS